MGIATDLIEAEVAAMQPVTVGPTKDRKAIGSMVDFVKLASAHLVGGRNVSGLAGVEDRLVGTPCRGDGRFQDVIFPDRDTPRLLAAKWRNALSTYVPNYGRTSH